MMTFSDFEKLVDHDFHTNELRYGQTVMNTLHQSWPEKYQQLVGTNMDCFYYNDQDTTKVMEYLRKAWDDQYYDQHR